MTLIIAEAGVNHNGNDKLAFALVEAASQSGADVVKFQTFKAENLTTSSARLADYQIKNTLGKESQLSMLRRLELSYAMHHQLVKYCQELGIEFLSTAFDSDSLKFLVEDIGLKTLKIPSGDITNAPLVLEHARTGRDLIVSTGMSTLAEVEAVLGVIAFGFISEVDARPSFEAFQEAYFSKQGQRIIKEKITLLHCTTEYPAPMEDINLKTMDTLATAFNLPVGYSDHSAGITIPIAAVARGAVLLEKHFTLDRKMEGPDHKASLEPKELGEMVKAIRSVEKALGDGLKGPRPSEMKNKLIARKSIVANTKICAGDIFSKQNLAIKRPGDGASPFRYWELLDSKARKNYNEGEVIFD